MSTSITVYAGASVHVDQRRVSNSDGGFDCISIAIYDTDGVCQNITVYADQPEPRSLALTLAVSGFSVSTGRKEVD